jgi:predicted porin
MKSLRQMSAATAAFGAFVACMPAHAQSTVNVYGLVDMSAGRWQPAGTAKVSRVDSGNMTTSFIGFKGTEDLGSGLKTVFALEHFLRADTGEAGRFGGDAFWARSAFVGLSSGAGTVTLGRNTTPYFVSALVFNPFGDSFGFSPTIRQYFGDSGGVIVGDTGWSNSIGYESPKFGGLSFSALGNLGEGTGTGKNFGGNVLYFAGPLSLTVAAQQVKNPTPGIAGFSRQNAYQFGGAYDVGMAKLYLQLSQVKTDATVDATHKLVDVGASVPVGAGNVLMQYGQRKTSATGVKWQTTSVGYDYNLSKNTDLYAVFMNDKATGLNSGNSLMGGLRLRF